MTDFPETTKAKAYPSRRPVLFEQRLRGPTEPIAQAMNHEIAMEKGIHQ